MKILIFDNYDSFTYNLVHVVEKIIHDKVHVYRNDKIPLEKVNDYDKIILSPGPGLPVESGLLLPLIKEYASSKSILGVCLGQQAIGEAFGGSLINLSTVYHGVATKIKVNPARTKSENDIFNSLDNELEVGRYHSWIVSNKNFPKELEITAEDENGYIMALRHKTFDVQGVQFHPESVLTPMGERMMKNWLKYSMKEILKYLFEHKTLSRDKAKEILMNISKGIYSDVELASFTTVYLMRSITIPELLGFRDALIELCVPVNLKPFSVLDIVGTGGDGKNTFNISTLSCFIVAGTGQKIAKHGNYGASSISGASNVMEAYGYKFSSDNKKLLNEVDKANICFMHAPLFHPALKVVAPVRKNLGVRTFFNMLGPMVNPALPDVHVIGVYNLEMARIYSYLLQQSNAKFTIVHSLDGYDEISLTDDAKIITNNGEKIYTAEYLGKRMVSPQDIYGGNSTDEAAKIFLKILKGEGSWAQNAVVIANAAIALSSTENFPDYEHCYALAVESLEAGKAYQSFKKLISLQ